MAPEKTCIDKAEELLRGAQAGPVDDPRLLRRMVAHLQG